MTRKKRHEADPECWCRPVWGYKDAWGWIHSDDTVVLAPSPMSVQEAYELMGSRLRAAREEAGLRNVDVAKRMGVKPSHVSRIEVGWVKNGKYPWYLSLRALLQYTTAVTGGDDAARSQVLSDVLDGVYLE